MSRPVRMDDRYPGHRMPPRVGKPKSVDVSGLHKYMHPGDQDGNGMYVLYADTMAELVQKMAEKYDDSGPVFTGTALPESPNVIKRQGGYTVDGEPQR